MQQQQQPLHREQLAGVSQQQSSTGSLPEGRASCSSCRTGKVGWLLLSSTHSSRQRTVQWPLQLMLQQIRSSSRHQATFLSAGWQRRKSVLH